MASPLLKFFASIDFKKPAWSISFSYSGRGRAAKREEAGRICFAYSGPFSATSIKNRAMSKNSCLPLRTLIKPSGINDGPLSLRSSISFFEMVMSLPSTALSRMTTASLLSSAKSPDTVFPALVVITTVSKPFLITLEGRIMDSTR